MADIAVSSEAVHAASGDVAGYLAAFDERLRECQAKVSGVAGTEWKGAAADKFQAVWAEWSQGAAEIHEALAGMARLLADAASSYETTERDVTTGATGAAPTVSPITSGFGSGSN